MDIKPKIGILHYSYPPIIGGVETMIRQQAHQFSDRGFPVTVLVGEGVSHRPEIKLFEIPELKSLRNINPTIYQQILDQKDFPPGFIELSDQIYKQLEAYLPTLDVIIVHDMLTLKFNIAFNFAFRRFVEAYPQKKYIAWTSDVSLDEDRERAVFINDKVEELIYKPFPNVYYVAISQFMKNSLVETIGFPKDSIYVIPNAIPLMEFLDLQPETRRLVQKHHVFEADPVFFIPGKMMPHKNIDIAVKVVSELKKTYSNPKLVISARAFHHNKDFEYLWKIDSMIHELELDKNVLIIQDELTPGANDLAVLKDFYKICDVVFYLSSYENFGLPILEAGLSKNIIICSDLQVFKEISPQNIFTANISRPPYEIAAYVKEVLESQRTNNLFRTIKSKYSLEAVFDTHILPFLSQIMGQVPQTPVAPKIT